MKDLKDLIAIWKVRLTLDAITIMESAKAEGRTCYTSEENAILDKLAMEYETVLMLMQSTT